MKKTGALLKKYYSKERGLAILSLAATPFIVFFVTSAELYLKNRIDLDDKMIVLAPFLALFILVAAAGCLLFYFSSKNKTAKILLGAYYLAGPAFLVFSAIRNIQTDNIWKLLFLSVLFFSGLFFVHKKLETGKLVRIFAWLSAILIISEAAIIFNGLKGEESGGQNGDVGGIKAEKTDNKKLPNVYHIIFDEYQTDMFGLTLDEQTKSSLAGFTYFPNNAAVYGRTGMSLPTIFTGLSYDYEMPQLEYQKQAFNSDKSFLYWLKKSGYETNAYVHKVYSFDLELFDSFIEHKKNTRLRLDNISYIKLFASLWIYGNAPKSVSKKIIKPEAFDQIKNQNFLSESAPIVSYESFNNILGDVKTLKKDNQYFFIHLMLPHFPYTFRPDCSYDEKTESSPLEQSRCATKTMINFISTLKKLGKFDDSMIIIQSDHGSRFRADNNDLVKIGGGYFSEEWSLARSRSLLLIKNPGEKVANPLVISEAESSLLDIAPTIINALGIKADMNCEGVPLNNPESWPAERSRFYHFFDKKGSNEATDELSRYVIESGKIRFEKKIPLGK